jgi:hypothetical protein
MSRRIAIQHWKHLRSEMQHAVLDTKKAHAEEARFTGIIKPSGYERGWLSTFRMAVVHTSFMLVLAYLGLVKQRSWSEKAALVSYIKKQRFLRGQAEQTAENAGAFAAWDKWLYSIRMEPRWFHSHSEFVAAERSGEIARYEQQAA